MIVKDADAMEKMMSTALELLKDPGRIATLEENAGKMALPDAAQKIADEIYKLV
jgi:UDP-N-acetylglucosamine--N-acetylmuramyl-(pentapeptide) pyrophosphoryl-undecaprenol N-acetylglucosamine transferase